MLEEETIFEDRKVKNISILCMVLAIIFDAFGWININDGGTHVIDTVYNDYYGVQIDFNKPGIGTFVELKEGGRTTGCLVSHGDSEILVSGGRVDSWLIAEDNSKITVNGGEIKYSVRAYHQSEIVITGGIINQYLESWGNASVIVSGGRIGSIILAGYKNTNSTWPDYDTATLTLVGSNFEINGIHVANGRYYMDDYSSGHLKGMLQNGDLLDNDFQIWDGASIILIPEPTTVSLFALAGLLLRKRKR